MAYTYRPRGMPRRYMEGAPDIVRRGVLDLIRNPQPAVCDFDVILREGATAENVTGLDFDARGARGCHFFLSRFEAVAYRARCRRRRVAWRDLPEPTQRALVAYLEE